MAHDGRVALRRDRQLLFIELEQLAVQLARFVQELLVGLLAALHRPLCAHDVVLRLLLHTLKDLLGLHVADAR